QIESSVLYLLPSCPLPARGGAWAGVDTPRDWPLVLGAANGPGSRPRSPRAPPRRPAASRNPRRGRACSAPTHPVEHTYAPSPSEGRGGGGEGRPREPREIRRSDPEGTPASPTTGDKRRTTSD